MAKQSMSESLGEVIETCIGGHFVGKTLSIVGAAIKGKVTSVHFGEEGTLDFFLNDCSIADKIIVNPFNWHFRTIKGEKMSVAWLNLPIAIE